MFRKTSDFSCRKIISNGVLEAFMFFNSDGQIHRDGNLPAIIWVDQHGRPKIEEYYKNGVLHRESGSPLVYYYGGEKVEKEANTSIYGKIE